MFRLSADLKHDIETTVRARLSESRVLDVLTLAEEIRMRFEDENVALEDIAASVLQLATQTGQAVELRSERRLG